MTSVDAPVEPSNGRVVGNALAVALMAVALLVAACQTQPTSPAGALMELTTCQAAFEAWVGISSTLNTPGTDPVEVFLSAQVPEKRVFELCSLDEAEGHNLELQIHDAPGLSRSLIEPDIRTFAEVECLDDVELLGGTPLCAEVGHKVSLVSPSPRSTEGCGSATVSIDYLPYTTAILAGYDWDFVVADVVGFEPAIFNTRDGIPPPGYPATSPRIPNPDGNAETMIYTPINVVIDRTISGPWRPGPFQLLVEGGTVLLEGGPVGCFTMSVSPVPHVEPGSRYVFILSEALDAEGEKPLPLPKARFAWPVNQTGNVVTVDGNMSIEALTELVQEATSAAPGKS